MMFVAVWGVQREWRVGGNEDWFAACRSRIKFNRRDPVLTCPCKDSTLTRIAQQ